MTLVELMLAILLLSLVILTGISMELGVRRLFRSADLESQLLSEATGIMAMVTKDINRAIGSSTAPAFIFAAAPPTFQIRLDSNGNGRPEAGDIWVGYHWDAANYVVRYYPDVSGSTYQNLTNRAVNFTVLSPSGTPYIDVTLALRYQPASAENISNPRVELKTAVQTRSASYN